MKTISFICQKGGTGKTTLALNIAVEAMRRGLAVAVIDLDPQPSACTWSDLRGDGKGPIVIDAKPARLAAAVDTARASGDLDLLVIDTGGRTEEGAFAASKAADLVVMPLQPSAVDLKSVPATQNLVAMAGTSDALAVLMRVKSFGTRHFESVEALEAINVPVCTATVGERVAFQDAYAAGLAVSEYEPGSKGAREIALVTDELLARLDMTICRQSNKKKNRGDTHAPETTQSRRAS